MPAPTLPPIAGFMLTGLLAVVPAAHAPIILSHNLPAAFFGIEEREQRWPDHRSFNVYPITAAALQQLRALIEEEPRFDIGTDHAAFGWIIRPRALHPPTGLLKCPPALFATAGERVAALSGRIPGSEWSYTGAGC